MKTFNFLSILILIINFTNTNAQANKIAFVQNKGQWQSDVYFKADLPNGQALVTPTGMLVGQFDSASIQERSNWVMGVEDRQTGNQYLIDNPIAPDIKGHGWRYHFLNANPTPIIVNKGKSNDFYNYWLGDPSQHASKVSSFDEITYANIYNGVDVKYYSSPEGFLENDIIVKPYANHDIISFELEGIDEIALGNDGTLILGTSVGEVIIPAPVSYLLDNKGNKVPIIVNFELTNTIIRFQIPAYDNSKTLVIDPIVLRWATWATNSASSVSTHNHATGVDSLGFIYTTGLISSTGLITVGAFQSTAGGGMDMFIGKYQEPNSPGGAGVRVWQTYLGGARVDDNAALQVGSDGYIYIAANTYSNIPKTFGTGFTAGAWTQRTGNSGTFGQALIIKFDMGGNGAMAREIGSCTMDFSFRSSDIRTMKTGAYTYDLIWSGTILQPANKGTSDGDFPAPKTPSGVSYTQPATAALNAVVMRISRDLSTLTWIKNIGSDITSAKDEAITISIIDLSNNIFVAGYTRASENISFNNPSSQSTLVGIQDGWIMKLDANGNVLWSRFFNSIASGISSILNIEMNTNDTSLIISGTTNGLASANITSGAVQTTYGGGTSDLYVAKMSKSGATTIWGSYFGGSGAENNMMGLNIDKNDDIYFLGYTASINYPVTSKAVQSVNYGSNDAVFTKINAAGTTTLYSTYYGGSSDDNDPLGQRGIIFSNCKIYLSVSASSNNIPLTNGAITTSKASASGIFEPVIISIANPPDVLNNTINGAQTVACGAVPSTLTAGTAAYNIAGILRNGVTQTTGTVGAYPTGVPTPTGYQWQKSTDYMGSWSNISGATSQNYSPAAIYQTTFFRRTISGDYCSNNDSNVCILVTGGPRVNPAITCTSNTISFFANPTGGASNTYAWTGPLGFSSTSQNPQILAASNNNNGYYNVTITEAGGCKDSKTVLVDFNSCTYSVILSVSLLSFNAEKVGNHTKITWQTANEHNSESFEVLRSSDGNEWSAIGSVLAANISSEIIAYNFNDEAPLSGVNYYKLKVIETTGKYIFSSSRNVHFGEAAVNKLMNVVPNPFNTSFTVNFRSPVKGIVSITLMDAQGRILETVHAEANTLDNMVTLNTANYTKGVYFVSITYNEVKTDYQRIVKQ